MNLLRGLLLENLGLKLAALLLGVLVYLNVYLDRPADMVVSFPIEIDDLADTLALVTGPPSAVVAEVQGTGKQILRLRLTEPTVKLSLEGQGPGHMRRAITTADLPVGGPDSLHVTRLIGPSEIELTLDHRLTRDLPVAVRVLGVPAAGWRWEGTARIDPAVVQVTGPHAECARLDSVRLASISVAGARDSVRAQLAPATLPHSCTMRPPSVKVVVPVVRITP